MGDQCQADELRTLFLFEHLSEAQLAILCADGRIESLPPGPLFNEGEPATLFYVLIEGELVMSGRTGGFDVNTRRTTQRGAYCGAWNAYVPLPEHLYDVSVRLIRESRFYVLDADKFADFMQTQFHMAVHLLVGHTLGGLRQQQIVSQRARLLGLGTITAALTHQLNNPAAATGRAIAGLRESVGRLRHKLTTLADGGFTPDSLRALTVLQDAVADRVGTTSLTELSALESSDREERLGDWLDAHGVDDGWDYAPTFVDAGLDVAWLERVSTSIGSAAGEARKNVLQGAFEWLKHTIDAELRMREIAEASKRISALLAGAKQYSQMDRDDYQRVDVHELLRSTLMMFDTGAGAGGPIRVVMEFDQTLPEILCYAGDLNQVWTNLIDNAIEAMSGAGTLIVRTGWQSDETIRVEICDDGPGVADDVVDRIFTPFFSTKPEGEGTGLGLDLAWRIVQKHRGDLAVESVPGDTRFIVCLPLEAPAPEMAASDDPNHP
jgi:signal transduction histidine kinase